MRIHAVLRVVQRAKQPGMRSRQMIALKEIVDINFPVALDDVLAALGETEFVEVTTDISDLAGNIAKHLGEWRRLPILIHKDERTPRVHLEPRQADLRFVPILHAFEFRLAS